MVVTALMTLAFAGPAAADGRIYALAGSGVPGFAGDGGSARNAELDAPWDLATLADGSVLVADSQNSRIRRVLPDGTIVTAAGSGPAAPGSAGDGGEAVLARLGSPMGVAATADGGFLIADTENHRIRRVSPDGVITTVAGSGPAGIEHGAFAGDGGPANRARLNLPADVAVAPDGAILIADSGNGRVRRVGGDGVIRTVAGSGRFGFSGDGGRATRSRLGPISAIAPLPGGGFLLADPANNRIRRVNRHGIITTVAGSGPAGRGAFAGDGGKATHARLDHPNGVVAFGGGFLVADSDNHRIRRVTASGRIFTLAGNGRPGLARDGQRPDAARLAFPQSLALRPSGELLVVDGSDRVLEIRPR